MARVIKATRSEAGCLDYSYAIDVLDAGLIRVCEKWASQGAVDSHFAAPHMVAWRREREMLAFCGRLIVKCEAGPESPI